MRKFYLGAVLLACIQPPTYAQLLNTQGALNQLNTVNRQLEVTTEQIQRKAERDLQQLKPTVNRLANTTDKLADPLLKLPQQLPILTSTGRTAFVEVEVENGWRAVQQEWLIMLDENELASLQQLPITIVEKTRFTELEMTLVRFHVPAELDSLAALKKQLPAGLAARLDRNHIYASQAVPTNTLENNSSSASVCKDAVKIGMIDTAIKIDHPSFNAQHSAGKITTRNFLEEKLAEPDAHGTAVAGLLIGKSGDLTPLLPNASVYAASVFYARNDYAQGATMINLVRALNWLLAENVAVINMSLAGPDNQILAAVIAKSISSGKAIVAAAGNEGPAAPPMFPAAYPNVIAATAVDHENKIYRWANRGSHIYFAAHGVSVLTARSSGGVGRESGTSMAAPVVSAFLSCELQKNNNMAIALKNLRSRAIDLGEPGRDTIFGYGLLDQTVNSAQ
jgi:minor extracellular protease Epr